MDAVARITLITSVIVLGGLVTISTFIRMQMLGLLSPEVWQAFSITVLSLAALGLCMTILLFGGIFATLAKDKGTKYLFTDMKYLGFEEDFIEGTEYYGTRSYKTNTSALVVAESSQNKPLNRSFAFLAYRGDILFGGFKKEKHSYASKSDKTGNLAKHNLGFINNQLRREVFEAISLEKKLFKSGQVEKIKDSSYPLASYLFVAADFEKLTKTYDRTKFFYENQFPLSAAKQLQAVEISKLQELSDVPPSWVVHLLVPTTEA